MLRLRRFLAFTLAETLVVIGIIGVVSALTLPNLNSSTGEKDTVAKVKKIYQNLSEAYDRATVVYGPYQTWFSSNDSIATKQEIFANRLTEFMKVSKTCPVNSTLCFTRDTFKTLGYGRQTDTPRAFPQVILSDGASVSIYLWESLGGVTYYVDIDGPNKGAYTSGKDIFTFTSSDSTNGVVPYSSDLSYCFKWGSGCAYWVIQNDNMEYLKANNDGQCKNGKQLSETQITCN